jgi:hypothetical protein
MSLISTLLAPILSVPALLVVTLLVPTLFIPTLVVIIQLLVLILFVLLVLIVSISVVCKLFELTILDVDPIHRCLKTLRLNQRLHLPFVGRGVFPACL